MLKWLIVIAIGYFIYRFYIAPPPAVKGGKEQDKIKVDNKVKDRPPSEYVDYEEVDDK